MESITAPTPAEPECEICHDSEGLYTMSGAYLCLEHVAEAVSLACDIWPGDVSYTWAFQQDVLL